MLKYVLFIFTNNNISIQSVIIFIYKYFQSIISFIRQGSLIVEYEVILPILNINETTLIAMDENLNKAATDWKTFSSLNVDIERTKRAIKSN